jgi:hypothetical protein
VKPAAKKIFMRTMLTGAFVFFFLTGFTQSTSYGNFKIIDQQLIFQKVFMEDSITFEKLGDYYTQLPYVADFDRSGDEMKFKIKDIVVDYKKFQISQVATPSFIQTGKFDGDVSVNVKDGKYRVTVSNLKFTGDMGYKKLTSKEDLTNYACRNSGTYISPDWCKANTLGLLDKTFIDKLQFFEKDAKKGDKEW